MEKTGAKNNMPTLVSEVDVSLERSDLLRRVIHPRNVGADGFIVPPARTPGLHLSGLLRYVAKKSKISMYAHEAEEKDDLPLRWFLGQIIEEGLASLYPEMVWQPGELTVPLIMTCDGISASEGSRVIEEFKCRRAKKLTGARLLQEKWIFLQQGMGYCLGYGANYVRWHILALFEFPDPVYTQYLVHFSDEELEETSRMIERNKDKAIGEGYAE